MEYRVLSRAEIDKLVELDRRETIEYIYYIRDGKLSLEKEHWDVKDWSALEKQRRIAGLQKGYDNGGYALWGFRWTDTRRVIGA